MASYNQGNLLILSSKLNEAHESHDRTEVLNTLISVNNYLKDQYSHSSQDYLHVAGSSGSLIKVLECQTCPYQCHIEASKALHYLTFAEPEVISQAKHKNTHIFPPEVTATVQKLSISILKQQHPSDLNFPHLEYSHLITSCLTILYNLVICSPDEVLGSIILNACHPFTFYGLPGVKRPDFMEKEEASLIPNEQFISLDADSSSRTYTNRNRRKRLRRKRAQPSRSTSSNNGSIKVSSSNANSLLPTAAFIPRTPPSPHSLSFKPQWIKCDSGQSENPKVNTIQGSSVLGTETTTAISGDAMNPEYTTIKKWSLGSSVNRFVPQKEAEKFIPKTTNQNFLYCKKRESSDNENEPEKVYSVEAKVRQCALITINAIIDKAGRQNKFSYWPQMMCKSPSLMTCILKDPSSSVRMAALQVINTFLIDSQPVLNMAVDDSGSGSYITLGRQLGTSIRELHRCLALALLSEKIPSSLVRILKTFELLVENVNYSNLKPGLLTKIITHVKYFLRYKEAVVRANAFSVMVSFLMIKPQLPEIKDLLTRYQTRAPQSFFAPPVVRPPSPYEEVLEDDVEETEDSLKRKMENLELTSDESFSSDSGSEVEGSKTTVVSWIVQRCIDSLLLQKRENIQGIYIQVQLQSLKALSALVSEHLCLISCSLPLIQHVIMVCCELRMLPKDNADRENLGFTRDNFDTTCNDVYDQDTSLISPDPDVVVEHSFLLLSSLLGSVKNQLERGKKHNLSEVEADTCITPQMALQLWLWALQHPLKPFFEICSDSIQSQVTNDDEEDQTTCNERNAIENYQLKPMIAAANVLSHICSSVLENLGEPLLNQFVRMVRYLLSNKEFQLQLSGIRIMAIIVTYPSIKEHSCGPELVTLTMKFTTHLLIIKHSSVNKDRLLASWALANVFSVIHAYRETSEAIGQNDFLEKSLLLDVIEAGIVGCQDKDKIKPHAVRCVGNAVAFLPPHLISDPDMCNKVKKAIEILIECCSTGNNMKMRWNACHAFGNILMSKNIMANSSTWRSSVVTSLSSLVERFRNYKVRIQACIALCSITTRDAYGNEFGFVWKSILQGLEDSQNISDFQEIQHRDELINQLCLGLCHLTCLLCLEDLELLTDRLLFHQDTVKALLVKAHGSLPPEQVTCILKAAERLNQLQNLDALTLVQGQGLSILYELFKDIS